MCTISKYFVLIIAINFFNLTLGAGQNCIYPTTDLYLQNSNCSLTTEFCLDIPFENRSDFEVFIDGSPYTGAYTPCNFEIETFYNISILKEYFASVVNPDMVIDSVIIDNINYSFEILSIQGLKDTMNSIDPNSDWFFNSDSTALEHLHNSSTYSALYFNDRASTNPPFRADFQRITTPSGVTIEMTNNVHEVVLNEINSLCRDTITVDVYCLDNTVVIDTVELNQIDTICLSLDDLRGSLLSIDNICPERSGTYSFIDPIAGTACIEISGLDVGRDSACFVLTDSEGLRDTVYYTLQIIQPIDQEEFFATEDDVTTIINQPIIFNPTMNDGIPNSLDTIFILNPPSFGTAFVNPDGTFLYQPDIDYESNGSPDSLTYMICIMSDCRIATVFINVVPPTIDVRTGFSPNEDGVNDTFVIENLDQFPNNQLCVFNRWGNQVLQVENYQNNWDGTWDDRQVLPDGTYFYVLDVEVDSIMEQYTGFVQLRR